MVNKEELRILSKSGLTCREVAEVLGCSYQYVSLVLRTDLLGVDPCKSSKKVYQSSEKGRKASSKASVKYAKTLKGKETHKKYWGTKKGKETRRRYNLKRLLRKVGKDMSCDYKASEDGVIEFQVIRYSNGEVLKTVRVEGLEPEEEVDINVIEGIVK